ncbi:hypothetical protein [Guptibacillus algicola]|uniref:hypothetical protein n=1 Tax=Guptibacillus algicola TaxID=225844 RepID=UPI001CD572B1|nr:hypothetical protein [Alkalihalobacillus algicola]MCA0987734.1 hypothetical protein [Alkalihalobacillus algicola]
MKRLNTYKIIGILVTLGLFFVVFNFLQNREADFEVDANVFNVMESSAELDNQMKQIIPQMKLAEQLDAVNTYNMTIPILELDRELEIHDAMVLAYGGIYLSYSFPLKKDDLPQDLPSLTVGKVSYDTEAEGSQSKVVNQQEMQYRNSMKPMVMDHRVYKAAVLIPADLETFRPDDDIHQLNYSKEVTLQNLKVNENGKKVSLDDVTLDLSNGYMGSPFAEADLNTTVQTKEGSITFSKFTANFHGNEIFFNTTLPDLSHILITQQFGEESYQHRYKVKKEGDEYSILLQPFYEFEEELNYEVTGISKDHNGSFSTTIDKEKLTQIKSGELLKAGSYGGITYSIGTEEIRGSHKLSLLLEGESHVHHEEVRTFNLMNGNEKDQHPYRQDFSSLSVEDRNRDEILIYDIEKSGDGFFVNLDMGHVTSLSPVTVNLSGLPNIVPVKGKISAPLTKVKKNK